MGPQATGQDPDPYCTHGLSSATEEGEKREQKNEEES